MRHRFGDLIGEPVTEAVLNARLYALNQLPGLSTQASFHPGNRVGETDLELNLVEVKTWSVAAAVDNHGDGDTGEERVSLTGSWLSPRGIGDALYAGIWQSANPWNQTFGYLRYDTPLGGTHEFFGHPFPQRLPLGKRHRCGCRWPGWVIWHSVRC